LLFFPSFLPYFPPFFPSFLSSPFHCFPCPILFSFPYLSFPPLPFPSSA
jgi:hypothetical protein